MELHLSPQFLPGWLVRRDPTTGRVAKWRLGPWMLRAFAVMARLRRLRGTPFDPFGRTAHRRLERRLIRDYEATVQALLEGLGPGKFDLAVEIAALPEHVRGFDTIKEQSAAEAARKQEELMRSFRLQADRGGAQPAAAG